MIGDANQNQGETTMDAITAIEQRRAVKHYDPTHRMTDGEVRRLLALAILSPTAINIQNWRFVVVRDPLLRRRLREAAWDQAQVTDSSAWIVLCADLKAWKRDPIRYWREAPPEVGEAMVQMMSVWDGKEQAQRDEAMRSCGMAAQTIMIAAKAMGYDTCPMTGFDFDAVAKLINLPADHVICMAVAVGKAAAPPRPRGGQLPLEEVVRFDRF
jgi:nitroreductase